MPTQTFAASFLLFSAVGSAFRMGVNKSPNWGADSLFAMDVPAFLLVLVLPAWETPHASFPALHSGRAPAATPQLWRATRVGSPLVHFSRTRPTPRKISYRRASELLVIPASFHSQVEAWAFFLREGTASVLHSIPSASYTSQKPLGAAHQIYSIAFGKSTSHRIYAKQHAPKIG